MNQYGLDLGTYYVFGFQARQPGFDQVMPLFQAGYFMGNLIVCLAVLLLTLRLLVRAGQTRVALAVLASFVIGLVLVEEMRYLMLRTQPPDASNWISRERLGPSFPSRPMLAATMAWTFFVLAVRTSASSRRVRLAATILGVFMVLWIFVSQLFVAQHFLTDLLAGLTGGAGFALIGWHLGQATASPGASAPGVMRTPP